MMKIVLIVFLAIIVVTLIIRLADGPKRLSKRSQIKYRSNNLVLCSGLIPTLLYLIFDFLDQV